MSALEIAIALVRKNGYTVIPPAGVGTRRISEPYVDEIDDPRSPHTGRIVIDLPEEDPNITRGAE